MELVDYLVYGVGFSAQLLFSARMLVQWISSERAGKVLSPIIFWQLSILASLLLMIYGVLRNDAVILLGQVFTYFIYIRNLRLKRAWRKNNIILRLIFVITPVVLVLWVLFDKDHSWERVLFNQEISYSMYLLGIVGQVIFMLRFVFQWYVSEKLEKSVLPAGFWIMSLIGSGLIIFYGVYRIDPVIIIGQAFGLIIYTRNLMLIGKKQVKEAKA